MRRIAVLFGLAFATCAALGPTAADAATPRQAAIAALKPRKQRGIDDSVALFAVKHPLRVGTVIGVQGDPRTVIRLRKPAFLFWEDLAHGFRFPHPSLLLLVDERGRPVLKRGMTTWPLINGRPAPFVRSGAAYFGAQGALYVRHRLRSDGTPRSLIAQVAQELPAVGLITVGPRDDPTFKSDFDALETTAGELHIKTEKATTVATLKQAIDNQVKAGKYDVMIYVGGHGLPPNGFYSVGGGKVPNTPKAQVEINGAVVNHRPIEGGVLYASDLATLLDGYKTNVRFTVVLDSCYGGRFIGPLSAVQNVSVVATATNANHFVRNGFGVAIAKGLKAYFSGMNRLGNLELPAAMQSSEMKQAIQLFQQRSPTENFPQLVPHGTTPAPPEPNLLPIHAVFKPSAPGAACAPPACTTVYTEYATGTALKYQWALAIPPDPLCANGFQPGAPLANQATWYHADANEGGQCNHSGGNYDASGAGHPGTVAVQVSDANYTCAATYYGTQGPNGAAEGDGPAPQPCQHK